jgi:hypothetical protein
LLLGFAFGMISAIPKFTNTTLFGSLFGHDDEERGISVGRKSMVVAT